MDITLNIFCKDHCKCHLIIKMYFYRFFFTLNLVQCSCVVSSKLVSSSSIILWKTNISDPFKKIKMTLISPKRLHLDKNYYRHMIALFVPCNFGYTNLPLGLIDSKIFKVVIVSAPPCIYIYLLSIQGEAITLSTLNISTIIRDTTILYI